VTENLADWTERTASERSAAWFERGEAFLADDRTTEAIDAMRRAVAGDRLNPAYILALSGALIDGSEDAPEEAAERLRDEARQLLTSLRQRQPDDAAVNLSLARLAVSRGDPVEAVRYYNHAMYGLEPDDPQFDRYRIRVELTSFLLADGDRTAALAELFALAREVPNELPARLEIADLFLAAGEPGEALTQYSIAMAIDQTSEPAAVGAGRASFALADFRQAQQQLEWAVGLGVDDEEVTGLLQTTRLVRMVDPLARGLATSERVRRLRVGLDWAAARLETCAVVPAPRPGGEGTVAPPDDPLVIELRTFGDQPAATLREANTLTDGIDLIVRALAEIRTRCEGQEPDPMDEAWRAIDRARQGTPS
jgi:tetratricopeptide (TPR) repeat protein